MTKVIDCRSHAQFWYTWYSKTLQDTCCGMNSQDPCPVLVHALRICNTLAKTLPDSHVPIL